ncbi:uncharacterized protein LOC129285656 isoform X3 [Prosopis cineraria]|uniref:uncharacterized protein LOC129285656 isoform X3 n=1 Tax=Prosopis cineraria TaxID=364024 RepID=UPI00240F9BA0|nr:uncharacterized protein LOC129285656 isoform X3 [Prosopis cineraria]
MSGKGGGGGGSGNGKGSNGLAGVPAASRKMVQSLKEIVSNFPEHEIYAMLKECNMDPNEAVSRLLSQDPFHEVKSKREKKKENKDIPDSRSRATNYASSRGSRAGTDRRAGTSQFNSSGTDSGLLQGKPVYKKENGTNAPGGPMSSSSILGNNVNWRMPSHSDSVATEACVSDGPSSSQHGGMQSGWMGFPGQVSMADIVKMGRPQAKISVLNSSINSNSHHNVLLPPSASHQSQSLHSLHVSEANADQGFSISHDVCQNEEWPSVEHQSASNASSIVDVLPNSEYYGISTNLDEANRQQRSHLEERLVEDAPLEAADNAVPASISARSISDDNAGGASVFDDNLYKDKNPYQPQRHPFSNDEAEGVSSMSAHLEQLSLRKDDQVEDSEEENDSVVIPDHLQLHNPECLNLSFGSFGSGTNAAFPSGPYASRPVRSNSEETSAATDVATIGPSDSRHSDYYEDEHLTSASDGNLVQRTDVSAGPYNSPSISQPEVLKPESPPEADQGNQYSFPSSSHGFTYDNSQQQDVPYSHSQTNSQIQNLTPFSSVMQGYTNSLPGALLGSTVQTARDDIPYLPFPATQSLPAKYSNIASSIGGSTISTSETLRASSISTPQPNSQTLPGASVATGPSLPQHLAVHPYSQPTLPLGHFANMISYPFLPQSYTYMPSAFQQAFPGNGTYHQSLAAALPQYKSSVSVSSLPQSATVASGYGFGSSTSMPGGNFPLNPPAAPTGTTIGYEDVINSQFKDNNHMISLLQNENSPMWVHGPASRTMSAVPGSTYYGFQGQNQQSSGFRQSQQQQQPSQHFGPPGYPNLYSQAGISLEHHHHQQQQHNAREASLGGVPQGPPQASKQSQQLWHHSY